MWIKLTEQKVSLLVVEAEDSERLPAGSELAVGHVVSGMNQFDESSLPTSSQNAAELSCCLSSAGHLHRGPGQGEELLTVGGTANVRSSLLHQHFTGNLKIRTLSVDINRSDTHKTVNLKATANKYVK